MRYRYQRLDLAAQSSGMTDAHATLPVFRHRVEPAAVAMVADVLHDPNPIHFDPAAVQVAGLGDRPINQGPANLAYAVNMLLAAFPDYRIATLTSRYLANVLVGDTVEAVGEIDSRQDGKIVCRFRVINAAGQDSVVGTATLSEKDMI